MKKPSLTLALLGLFFWASAQVGIEPKILITEVIGGDMVELYNAGDVEEDVSTYWFCDFPAYSMVGNFDIVCGNFLMQPGETLVVCGWSVDPLDSELGLYTTNSFNNSAALMDYVEWGSSGHVRSSVAVAAGVWTADNFLPAIEDGLSAQKTVMDDITSNAWHMVPPLICRAFNEVPDGPVPCEGDLNNTFTVDAADVLILLSAFGSICQ